MQRGERQFLIFVGCLLAVMVISIAFMFCGLSAAALLIGMFGPSGVVVAGLLYAGYDSRQRWPSDSFVQRLGKILSFTR
jgi:hypothetical protein